MNRRRMLLGLGGLCAAGGAAIGTGALTSVSAERTIDVDVEGDSNAFVGLFDTSSGSFVDKNAGSLRILLDDSSGGGGTGVNHGTSNGDIATTTLDPAFTITNQGPDDMFVFIDHTGVNGSGNDAQFIADDEASNSGTTDADQAGGDVVDDETTTDAEAVTPPIAFMDRDGTTTAVTTSVNTGSTTLTIGDGGYLKMEPGESVDVILQIASDGTTSEDLIGTATVQAYSSGSEYTATQIESVENV